MWWMLPCSSAAPRAWLAEQVDGAEQTDPDDIDEVPVVAGHLDGVVVAGGELAGAGAQQHDEDEGGAAGDVGAVEAGEGEEGRPEDAAGQGHAFVDELAVLVGLAGEEAEAEHQGDDQPQHQAALVVLADGPDAELERDAGGDQRGGEEGGVPGLQVGGFRGRPLGGGRADGEVGAEQAAEEHHLGGDEQHHPEQRRADAAGPVAGFVFPHRGVCDCHQRAPVPMVVPAWTVGSSFACRRSNSGRSEWISGRLSKLCAGGGELVYHSSELPSHGSSGSRSRRRTVNTTLARNGAVDSAMIRAPTVSSWLMPTQLGRAA